MYTDKGGRIWSSEELYNKITSIKTDNFECTLLFEDYSDCTGDNSIYEDDAFKEFRNYRQNKDTMTEEELLESVIKTNNLFKKLIEKVGSEHFTFYEDGTASFNWPKTEKTKSSCYHKHFD